MDPTPPDRQEAALTRAVMDAVLGFPEAQIRNAKLESRLLCDLFRYLLADLREQPESFQEMLNCLLRMAQAHIVDAGQAIQPEPRKVGGIRGKGGQLGF